MLFPVKKGHKAIEYKEESQKSFLVGTWPWLKPRDPFSHRERREMNQEKHLFYSFFYLALLPREQNDCSFDIIFGEHFLGNQILLVT